MFISLFLRKLIDTADCERILKIYAKLRPAEFLIVWYYKKPLKKCSLNEVIEGIIFTTRMGNWFDTINHKDNGNYYSLEVNHVLKMKGSRLFNAFFKDCSKHTMRKRRVKYPKLAFSLRYTKIIIVKD